MVDMSDPRADNCRAFATDAGGKVTGVALQVDVRPATRYALVRVELIDEVAAQGNTVATCVVLDRGGLMIGQPVSLAWPWPGLTDYALPGNPNNQHMITNGYAPPAVGPLALGIREQGVIISDVVGGLGLPFNRHVSYRATWRERDPDAPEPGGDDGDDGAFDDPLCELLAQGLAAQLRIADALERLAGHLGA